MKNFKRHTTVILHGNRLRSIVLLLLLTISIGTRSQRDSVSHIIGFGSANILDTYLSPETYSGGELRFVTTRIHRHKQSAWQWRLAWHGDVTMTNNRADNVDEIGGELNVQYAWQRNWQIGKVGVSIGPNAEGKLGFLYNTRNQNNPAQAQAALNIGVAFTATMPLGTLLHRPITLSYDGSLPCFGLMFSPNYGQSYYEIFSRDNYDNNIVPTTLITTPSYRHALNMAVRLRKASIIVGYMGDYQQAKINNLKYRHCSHLFTIGYSKCF